MGHPPTYIGAPWQKGLPPGVYEERIPTEAPRHVRMDVAAFVGLTERGPVATPVVVESWEEFLTYFGEAGGGRLLPQSVYLFFANGGRRCVVVRALNHSGARTANWSLDGLRTSEGICVRLFARNPGSWGNGLRTTLRFRLLPLGPSVLRLPDGDTPVQPGELLGDGDLLPAGTLIRLLAKRDPVAMLDRNIKPEEALRFVEGVRRLENGQTALRFDRPITGPFLSEQVFDSASEVRVGLDVALKQEQVETWTDAALHPAHPRFLIRLIRRRAPCELYMKADAFEDGRPDTRWAHARDLPGETIPDGEWLEADRADEVLLDMDRRRGGSCFIRPLYFQWNEPLLPSVSLYEGESGATSGPDELDEAYRGDDAAEGTAREHFFDPPRRPSVGLDHRLYGYSDQPAPLSSVDVYDERNHTQPVSLVHFPDLVHSRSFEQVVPPPAKPESPDDLRFGDCVPAESEGAALRYTLYPLLAVSHEFEKIKSYQRRLIDWCEQHRDRVAVLELPPVLAPNQVVQWRRGLTSQRAAIYAPYLRCAPVEDPLAPLCTLSPGGAVCGVIARKEGLAGVQAAPANEEVTGISGLYEDPQFPDPALLHEARINAIRVTARGFELLGSRTTCTDRAWTHLPVRRLIDYLERQLSLDSQWAVFEPNDRLLWSRLWQRTEQRLRALYDRGAFNGGSEQEAFFIRCDGQLNTDSIRDRGQVIVLVGVAPAWPAEFILFRLVREAEGGVRVEESGG